MKRHRVIILNTIVFVILLVSMALFMLSIVNYKKTENKIVEFDNQTTNVLLRVIDSYDKDGEKTLNEFFSETDSLERMKLFNKELNNKYEYIEIDKQDLLIKSDNFNYKDICRSDYGTSIWKENDNIGIFLKSIQLNESAYKYFSITNKIKDGKGFEEKDYNYNQTIPVILGSEYKELLNLGDNYTFEYIAKDIQVEVIGFFEKNASVVINDEIIFLDNYIVMPFINVESKPLNVEEDRFQKILYSLKNWGYIKVKDGENYYKYNSEIVTISEQLGLKYVANEGSISQYIHNISASFNSIEFIFLILAIGILLISIIVNILLNIWNYKQNRKIYAIHMICGCSIFLIKIKIFGEIIIKYIMAVIGGILFNYYLQTTKMEYIYRLDILHKSSEIVIIVGLLMIIITYMILNYYIKNNSIQEVIKGDILL